MNPSLVRFHLFGGGTLNNRLRRAWTIALFCWVPYLIASLIAGPSITDLPTHVRFLIALPILISAERMVNRQVLLAVHHLLISDLLTSAGRRKFLRDLSKAIQIRDSKVVQRMGIFLILGVAIERAILTLNSGEIPPFRTIWITYFGLPIFQFVLWKWSVRILIWTHILWGLSRTRLRINPSHPDRKGGLGFLNRVQISFAWVPLALASVLVADRWSHLGVRSREVDWSIHAPWIQGLLQNLGALLLFSLFLFTGPLLFFFGQLYRKKCYRVLDFTRFSDRCVSEFYQKWIFEHSPCAMPRHPVLSQDVSIITDLINADNQTQRMEVLLPDRTTILPFIFACVLPLVPPLLMKLPTEVLMEIAKKIVL